MRNIVIVGASFAGVSAAHYLLRHIISKLPSDWKITLIGPSTALFFKIAAPRALVRPDLVPPHSLMPDIPQAFAQYPADRFFFIQAWATGLNVETREVKIQKVNPSSHMESIHYDVLVLATGTASTSPMWSPCEPSEVTLKAMQEAHASLGPAKKIVVVGGGPAGVEVAGELGSEFGGSKEITLYSGGSQLLEMIHPSFGQDAERYLTSMGVKVVHNLRLKSSQKAPNGSMTLSFYNSETVSTDVFLPTTGGSPNNGFIPLLWLNEQGKVKVDCHLRVEGAGPNVYSLGSLASYSHGGILDVTDAVAPLGKVIEYDLTHGKSGTEAVFRRNERDNMIVPVGRSKAVGVVFDIKIPSFLAWLIKGRNYLVQSAVPYSRGDSFRKP